MNMSKHPMEYRLKFRRRKSTKVRDLEFLHDEHVTSDYYKTSVCCKAKKPKIKINLGKAP